MDNDDRGPETFVSLDNYRMTRTSSMVNAELRALQTYWESIRHGRLTPLRSDVDPREMECDARNLFILENLGNGNIRFRLAGTAIVNAFGMELRGLNVRSIMAPSARESFAALINEALEDPGTGYARLVDTNDPDGVWEVNLLPLRSDFGMIDRMIGCLHPINNERPRRHGMPLRFEISRAHVESIDADQQRPARPRTPVGFAEPQKPFGGAQAASDGARPRLVAIEGGRDQTEAANKPSRGHLRLIDD